MRVRKTRTETTSSKPRAAARSTAAAFENICSVSAMTPPGTSLPVVGSWPTWPLKYRKPLTRIAWENGPTGGVSSGEIIAVLLMENSCGRGFDDQGRGAGGD